MRARVDGPIDVSVAGRHARSRPGIRVHNVRTLEWTTHRGIRVTTPARTLLDLAATRAPTISPAPSRRRACCGSSRDADLRAIVDAHPRRAGSAALRRELDVEARLTRSEAERRLLDLIRRAQLPLPETNVRVLGHEVDALWRAQRLIVEIDGFDAHGTRAAFERDRARDARLVAAGYRVIRITWRQLARRAGAHDRAARGRARSELTRLDLEQLLARRVVDLQRRVLDPEALADEAVELAAAGVAVVARRDEHVGGERREARRDLPDVQVVDLDDAGLRRRARGRPPRSARPPASPRAARAPRRAAAPTPSAPSGTRRAAPPARPPRRSP